MLLHLMDVMIVRGGVVLFDIHCSAMMVSKLDVSTFYSAAPSMSSSHSSKAIRFDSIGVVVVAFWRYCNTERSNMAPVVFVCDTSVWSSVEDCDGLSRTDCDDGSYSVLSSLMFLGPMCCIHEVHHHS
jgi:hypothetical protein